MAIRYVDSNTIMDLGEKIRFKSKVEPVCGVDIPFLHHFSGLRIDFR